MNIVGIVPKANQLFTTSFYNEDIYAFVNNYGKRLVDAGASPAGLIPVDGYIDETQLERCDAFLFSGGGRIFPYHIQVMEHAVRTGKKVLGICMGMQVIHTYFILLQEAEARAFEGDINDLYKTMKKERYMFTEPVEHHWDIDPTVEHMEEAKHEVTISEDSQLAGIIKTGLTRRVVTMHRYRITKPAEALAITAFADDGTIEGLEYGDKIIGVQFHPEAEEEFRELFAWLA